MGYERYPQNSNMGYFNPQDPQDYGRGYGSGRDDSYGYSSARDYEAAGTFDRNRGRSGGYGNDYRAGYGNDRSYGGEHRSGYGGDYRAGYGNDRSYGGGRDANDYSREYHGSYASDGHRFTDVGRNRNADRDRDHGRQPQGYQYDDRGFFNRAGDEVRSWFGDEEAERRRELDQRYDARYDRDQQGGRSPHDDHYGQWRRDQINSLDRDYDEYRRENHSKFANEFGTWRTERQTQRGSLSRVKEHQDVVGSDGQHVGTVDKVRGDRIILTKNDSDAGGRHHSIPSRWIETVDDNQVQIRKTADEAKAHWRDEERNQAFFGEDNARGDTNTSNGPHVLNRSFSGTY